MKEMRHTAASDNSDEAILLHQNATLAKQSGPLHQNCIKDPGSRLQDPGFQIQDPGSWI